MSDKYEYVLTRFGDKYALWGRTEREVKQLHVKFSNRPWWYLRLWGWNVGVDEQRIPT